MALQRAVNRLLRFVNDRFPPLPNPGGRESEEAYFDYQYRATEGLYRGLYGRYVDFRGMDLLDLGCGMGGRTAWYAAHSGCRSIVGVDVDEYSLSIARRESPKVVAGHPLRFQLIQPDLLPFPDGAFGAIISDETLEHVTRPEALLLECKRVLREGGYLCMSIGPLYYSSCGAHLYDYIHFRWPQVFLPKGVIAGFVRSLPEKQHKFTHRRAIDTFMGLNRYRAREYRRAFDGLGMRCVHLEYVREKGLMSRVPLFEDYFLKSIYCVLRK